MANRFLVRRKTLVSRADSSDLIKGKEVRVAGKVKQVESNDPMLAIVHFTDKTKALYEDLEELLPEHPSAATPSKQRSSTPKRKALSGSATKSPSSCKKPKPECTVIRKCRPALGDQPQPAQPPLPPPQSPPAPPPLPENSPPPSPHSNLLDNIQNSSSTSMISPVLTPLHTSSPKNMCMSLEKEVEASDISDNEVGEVHVTLDDVADMPSMVKKKKRTLEDLFGEVTALRNDITTFMNIMEPVMKNINEFMNAENAKKNVSQSKSLNLDWAYNFVEKWAGIEQEQETTTEQQQQQQTVTQQFAPTQPQEQTSTQQQQPQQNTNSSLGHSFPKKLLNTVPLHHQQPLYQTQQEPLQLTQQQPLQQTQQAQQTQQPVQQTQQPVQQTQQPVQQTQQQAQHTQQPLHQTQQTLQQAQQPVQPQAFFPTCNTNTTQAQVHVPFTFPIQHTLPLPDISNITSAPELEDTCNQALQNPYNMRWHRIKERSTSRVNMTWLVVLDSFRLDEMKDRNVRGIGKLPLDKEKMSYVKNIALAWYPLKVDENGHMAWRACEKNMDTYLRKAPYTVKIKEPNVI